MIKRMKDQMSENEFNEMKAAIEWVHFWMKDVKNAKNPTIYNLLSQVSDFATLAFYAGAEWERKRVEKENK